MRLIDADALKTIKSIQSADFNSIETIQKWIDDAPTINQWIPVSERLPEVGQDVIISVANGYLTWGCLYDVGYYWSCLYSLIPKDRVIAWMPLPEPYKEADT